MPRRRPSHRQQLSSPPPPPPMRPEQCLDGDQRQSPPHPPSPLPRSPPPPPPMPPEQRLHGYQRQSPPPSPSPLPPSPPPPPPMPPGQGHRGDSPQRPPPPTPPPPRQRLPPNVRHRRQRRSPLPTSPPPPPPMPPGQGHRGGPPQRPPPPTPPPPRQRPQRQRSPLPPSPPPPPPMPLRRFDPQGLSYSQIVQLHLPPTRSREDQPVPGQTPTPNPGPSPGQDIHDMLDKAVADGELDESQRRQELLATTKLEELSISNASSLSLPQSPSRPEENPEPRLVSGDLPSSPFHDLLDKAFADGMLDESQRRPEENPEPRLVSGDLPSPPFHDMLDKAFADGMLDESQRSQFLLDFANPEVNKEELFYNIASSLSQPQPTLFEVPAHSTLKLDSNLLSYSSVSALEPTSLFLKYYIRIDKDNFVHIYPNDCGGPFESLQDAQNAIDDHYLEQRKIMCFKGLSDEEKCVRTVLYWYHNGLRKHSAEAFADCTTRDPRKDLLRALLDQYNEDNDLAEGVAYHLEDIVSHKLYIEGKDCMHGSFSHFNIKMKTKGAGANEDIYFAEVMSVRGKYELYLLTCICVVKPDENGPCNVCGVDMKHPTDGRYNHGVPKLPRFRRSDDSEDLFEELFAVRDETWLREEEARVRQMVREGKAASCKLDAEKIQEVKEAKCSLEEDKTGHGEG